MKKILKEYKSFIVFCIGFLIISIIKYLFTGSGIPCIFSEITGLSCPGCGISRMLISMLKLEFYQAFRYNPLVFILLIISSIISVIILILRYKFNKKVVIPNWIYMCLLVNLIAYGILRNLPSFSYLLPTLVN